MERRKRGQDGGTRARQREETRQKLYEAALRIFRRDGVGGARIEDIAELAGTSRASFYFHFPTKEDVLVELLLASEARVGAAVESVPLSASIERTLAAVASGIAREWTDDARLFAEVGAVALQRAQLDPEARVNHPVRRALVARLDAAAARGEILDGIDTGLLADLFLVVAFAVAIAWASNPIMPLDPALNAACHLFLHGTVPRPSPAPKRKKKTRSRKEP